jgi:hypothetical protein
MAHRGLATDSQQKRGGLKTTYQCLHRGPALPEGEMSDTDAPLWHAWLRINRVLRVMKLASRR